MRSITLFLSRQISAYQTPKTTGEPPSCYNPNLSLISNIGQARELKQLLALHNYLPTKFSAKHLAQSARKITQMIKFHQSKTADRKKEILESQHFDFFKNLLNSFNSTDLSQISIEQFINFAVFLQKIIKFKDVFPSSSSVISQMEVEFKKKILLHFDSCNLKQFTFQQVCSLFNALNSSFSEEQQLRLLRQIHQLLLQKPYCTCFHLTILSQMLNESKKSSPEYHSLSKEIQILCYREVSLQFEEIKKYISTRFIIQIVNAFFNLNQEQMYPFLPIIIQRIRESPFDKTLFALFFRKDLNNFEKCLDKIKNENEHAKELKRMIYKGQSNNPIKTANNLSKQPIVGNQGKQNKASKPLFTKNKREIL